MPWIDVPQVPGAQRAAKARARAHDAKGRSWYSIRNATSPDEAELLLYDEIGGWWGATAEDFIADLQQVTSPNLRVRVNSPGGSVFEGIAIANAIRNHPATVTVQVDALAASIASVIAMAGDTLVMSPNSMLMIHDASGICMGDAAEMTQMAAVLDAISDNIAGAYAAKAGGTVEDWRAAMKAESWYKAQDAVDAGLADEALPASAAPSGDEPEMRARFDLSAYGYAGPPQPKPEPPTGRTEPARPRHRWH
ncbi:head maturation protease, ClpP-related [Actinacidiphila sp. DG2A-62]|uniref:head maturation protease, ClpP-related n=1 Tax=Actinacidiphila sp. DG2A-62 TaxID=3108821 RepID=UPI002DBAF753|nr:head maturation protease, ClpP-related [Actinacidiphila sp. DG2A-62]MEC3993991.1 head maturation protease, ClpP-related [Actinacidiphila sp. DG2A-62]